MSTERSRARRPVAAPTARSTPTGASARPAVAITAPSGCLPDAAIADRAAAFFTARGWSVQAGDSVFAREQRFAGPDDLRAGDLQRLATDPRVDLVLAARGGYGLSRLLDRFDYGAIAAGGVPIVGYSDFTAFSLALLARAGGISFAGPAATDFAAAQPDPWTVEQFFAVLQSPSHALELALDGPPATLRGRLWGSNLALLAAAVGTPYLPRVRGGLLFIEDINEPAYRIERMLYQLLHAGVLQRQRAILFGSFEPVPPQASDHGFDLAAVVAHLRARLEVPIYTGLPFGHVARKATLPIGAPATLVVRASAAQLAFRGYPALA